MNKKNVRKVLLMLAVAAMVMISAVSVSAATTIKRVTTANLNLREGPGTSYDRIVTIPKNTTLTLYNRNNASTWFRTKYKGVYGWVSAKYLKKSSGSSSDASGTKQTTAVQVVLRSSAKVSTSNKVTTIKKNKKVTVQKKYNNNWYKVKYGSKTGYIQAGLFVSDKENGAVYKVTTAKVNMRSKKKIANNVITVLPDDAKVQILSESGTWFHIKYKGVKGYIKSNYVTVGEGSNESESTSYTKETLSTAVNLRSQPKVTSSTKIRTLDEGEKVTVLSEYNSSWLYVRASDGTTGYIKAGNFKSDSASSQSTGITTANVNLREDRSLSSDPITVVPKNTEVTIVAAYNSGWYKVKYKGVTGYMKSGYFR